MEREWFRVKLGWSRKRGGKRKPGIEWEEKEKEGGREDVRDCRHRVGGGRGGMRDEGRDWEGNEVREGD